MALAGCLLIVLGLSPMLATAIATIYCLVLARVLAERGVPAAPGIDVYSPASPVGRAVLGALRRASRKAAFDAQVRFEEAVPER